MKKVFAVLSATLFLTSAAMAHGGQQHEQFDPNEKLGTVSFQTSCAADVQKPFNRGVALLHSFWYEEAQKQFADIEAKDPKCAMAYWGEAMSLFHQLWDRTDAAHLKQGRGLLEKAEAAEETSPREREYIAALAAYYDSSAHPKYEDRVIAYSRGMEKVYADNPKDDEAGAFYALSLLASEPERDSTFANRKKAIAILQKLFDEEPDHPGIPHYLIHACDTPQFAQEGLAAARKYASIAPSAPHAVHMPSHIFARLGLWQEDIQSNLASVAATEKASAMHMGGAGHELHAMHFLEYAYLQIGDNADAMAVVNKLTAISDPGPHDVLGHDYRAMAEAAFPALYALETHDWKAAERLQPPASSPPYDRAITYWAQAVGAGHLHDVISAAKAVEQYKKMVQETKKSKEAYVASSMDTELDEATAWLRFAEGKTEPATEILRGVADQQDQLGKGEVALPAREMLADMLLEMNQPEHALAEYETSLKTDPNRFNGLYGAGRAAELAKQADKANGYYSQLLKNCEGHTDRPELARIKTQVAEKGREE